MQNNIKEGNWYFTLMQRQYHRNGYVEVIADSYSSARQKMFRIFGDEWAFQYSYEEFKGQIKEFKLKKVATIYL